MEDPIVIPTAKSVQFTLQRSAPKTTDPAASAPAAKEERGPGGRSRGGPVVKLWQAEVNQNIADWQEELSTQSSLIDTLEELLQADLEALRAGKPPPEDNEEQRKALQSIWYLGVNTAGVELL